MMLAQALREKDIVVLLGAGGVGKTTIASASALEASRHRKTLVLTVDPARRLADSLGVKLGSEIVNVRPGLDALMLDSKAALDALVRKYAPSGETLSRILRSRFYEQLSDAFAGSEEFVAMGTLHDLLEEGGYECIVVDTPPSAHAVEFLRVNQKLIRVYDSGVVKYLFRPTRFLRMGGGYMMQLLSRWTSSEYIEEMAEFMTTFDQMFQDMEARVRRIDAVLNDASRASLHVVSAADEESIAATERLYREVVALGLSVDSVVLNRVLTPIPDAPWPSDEEVSRATGLTSDQARRFLEEAQVAARFHEALAQDQERFAAVLRARLDAPFVRVPALPGSVHDMDGLERVRTALFP